MNIDELFDKEAFKSVDQEILLAFKKLSEDIKGKDFNETLDLIIKFSENMPKNKNLSNDEKDAIIGTILNSLNKEEKNKFKYMMDMLS